jgi:hypothetical protein
MVKKIAWCTSHYTVEFAHAKAKELRDEGYKVSYGAYLEEDGKKYCKIYLDLNKTYYIKSALNSILWRVQNSGSSIEYSIFQEKKNIQAICEQFSIEIKIEVDRTDIIAIIDNDYELMASML